MASGSFTGSTNNKYIIPRIRWSSTTNVAANTSTVTAYFDLMKSSSSTSATKGTGSWAISINGSSGTVSKQVTLNCNNTYQQIGSRSVTVSHNSDGSKSIYIRVTGGISGTSYTSTSCGKTVTLDKIPRASGFSISPSSVAAGGTIGVNISRASSGFTHTVVLKFGSYSQTKTGIQTSTSFAIPMDYLYAIPKNASGVDSITVVTMNGSTKIGEATQFFTVTVPSSVIPTFTSLDVERIDGEVPSDWGIYVKGKSKAKLTLVGAAGAYGSQITGYSITGEGFGGTAQSLMTGYLPNSGDVTFSGYVKDSRGRNSQSQTQTITVVDYYNPSIRNVTVQRCLEDGTISNTGTYLKCRAQFEYASCEGHNAVTTKVQYRKAGTSSWITAGEFACDADFVIGDGNIEQISSYEVLFSVQDAFATTTYLENIPTSKKILNIRNDGNGIAFGKVSEQTGMEVAWDATYEKRIGIGKDPAEGLPDGSIDVSNGYYLNGTPAFQYSSTTYHVSTTGSDEEGDGTEERPFATIAKAVSIMPLSARQLTVSIEEGVYTENVNLTHVPFTLTINSKDLSKTVSIQSIYVAYCPHLDIRGITFTGNTTATNNPQLSLAYIHSAYIANCKFNGGIGVTGIKADYGSNVFMYACTLNNCGFTPIYSGHGSTVTVERPSGSGNGVLFYAEAGLIYYYYATSFLGSSLKTEALGGEVRTAG